MTPVVKLDALQVLAIAAVGVVLGIWLKRVIAVLDKLNIPAPIVGGLIYAVLILVLRDRVVNFEMDLSLQSILMIAFFTTIGLGASLKLLKIGGPQVALFFGIATVGAVLQNVLGVAVTTALGINPLLGVIAGSVALTGGPATALAFGKTFESMGVAGATTLGVASAMFGITAGGLLGGFIGGSLIRRGNLHAAARTNRPGIHAAETLAFDSEPVSLPQTANPMADESEGERSPLLSTVIVIAIAMGIGTLVTIGLQSIRLGERPLVMPGYIGAMIAAAAIRNLDDVFGFANISQRTVDEVGNIALYLFIVMALLTLRLWELVNLALPFLLLLVAQIILVWLMCVFLAYRFMGRDYEAAVMSGGFCGFMLGTTANAMACMDVLTKKYGPAPRAYLVVPIVGAFLIDFTNALIITGATNWIQDKLLK